MSLPTAIASREIEIAWGHNREDKNFRNLKGSFGQLFEEGALLSKFAAGDKDGTCILSGVIVGGGGQRIAKNMTKNYLVMFDHDTGETVDEIAAKIENAGLFAVLWTTYSHMQPETMVSEDALLKWLRKSGHKTDPIAETQVVEFLIETKKIKPAVFAGDLTLTRVHVEGGMKYRLTHAPMPRVRSMFLLDKPFDFAQRGSSQLAAIQEWKERYAGLAHMLGVAWDRSCVDPSRLMYTPRVAPGTDLAALGHEIRVIPGEPLDLEMIPRVAEKGPKTAALRGPRDSVRKSDMNGFRTPGLKAFIRDHATDFEAATWLETSFPDDVRSGAGSGKIEFRCPREDKHSEQKADDRGFVVIDASASESGQFHMGCLHAGCIEESNKDRAWYLAELCKHYGATTEDLLEFCPGARETKDERAALQEIIASATFSGDYPDADSRHDLMARIAIAWDGEADRKMIARKMAQALGSGELRHALLREMKAASATQNPYGGPPESGSAATVICLDWDEADKNRVLEERLKSLDLPRYFRRAEGGAVLLSRDETSGRTKFEEMDRDAWSYEIATCVKCVMSGTDPRGVPTFGSLITHMQGGGWRKLPLIDKVVHVPMFDSNGTLITAPGYDPATRVYLDPPSGVTFHPVDFDAVSEADVTAARSLFEDVLWDFPFSDVFDDTTEEEQFVTTLDGTQRPNTERGKASRAHFMALCLEPFVRALIDGPCPMYFVTAPSPGSGKDTLIRVAGVIAKGGTGYTPRTMPTDETETQKVIVASLRAGDQTIWLNNCDGDGSRRDKATITSATLESALTARTFQGRILGLSEMVSVPYNATTILDGNNPSLGEALTRRALPIKLDPNKENAERTYRHEDFDSYLTAKRLELVRACHVLCAWWIKNGRPVFSGKPLASFVAYSRVMGGILEAGGIGGFLGSLSTFQKFENEQRDSALALFRFLLRQPAIIAGSGILSSDIALALKENPIIAGACDFDATGKDLAKSVGWRLRSLKDQTRTIDGVRWKLVKRPHTELGAEYSLRKL